LFLSLLFVCSFFVVVSFSNINEGLIAAGFAEALQHRMDEERSQFYDVLLAAEQKAKEAGRGKWDPKEKVVHRVQDLTDRPRPRRKAPAGASAAAAAAKPKKVNEDGTEADAEEGDDDEPAPAAAASAKAAPPSKAELEAQTRAKNLSARAKQLLPLLQREKKADAVVEFVFSASRFKLLIPKENVLISFSLAGVRTPATRAVDGKPVDPLAEEILSYVRSRVQQHSVKIDVEGQWTHICNKRTNAAACVRLCDLARASCTHSQHRPLHATTILWRLTVICFVVAP
jgi:hypothetical protein